MNWVTYKNRTSSAYKFSTDDRNDPVIDELKAAVKVWNARIHRLFECGYYTEFQPRHMYGSSNKIQPWKTPEHMRLKRVDLKGRGPRRQLGRYYYHGLPLDLAKHFDVYVGNIR